MPRRRSRWARRILLVRHVEGNQWTTPGGLIEPEETPADAAVREAWEETGVESELVAPLDTIEYWFQAREGRELVRIHKRVHFFLLEATSGEIGRRDREVDEARWIALGDASEPLSFRSERPVVELARPLIAPVP